MAFKTDYEMTRVLDNDREKVDEIRERWRQATDSAEAMAATMRLEGVAERMYVAVQADMEEAMHEAAQNLHAAIQQMEALRAIIDRAVRATRQARSARESAGFKL